MRVVFKFFLFALIFCFASSATAQEVGRAKDGRAYRKSADGFKIKDHIAELEVTIDGLKRQVYSLEDELEEKNATISRLNGGKPVARKEIKEANLVNSKAVRATLPAPNNCRALQDKVNMLELTLKKVNRVGAAEVAADAGRADTLRCQRELSQTKQSLASMSSQVSRLQGALMEGPSEKTLERERGASQELQRQLAKARTELSQSAKSKASVESQIAALNAKIASLEGDVKSEKAKAVNLEADVKAAQTQVASLQGQLKQANSMAKSAKSGSTPRRASMTPKRATNRVVKARKSSIVKTGSINKTKAILNKQLGQVQSLIIKRKDRLDVLKRKNKSVGVKIQSLKTKKGKSLDSIRVQVRRLSDPGQQFQLESEIAQIKKILEQDVALLSRLSKL